MRREEVTMKVGNKTFKIEGEENIRKWLESGLDVDEYEVLNRMRRMRRKKNKKVK